MKSFWSNHGDGFTQIRKREMGLSSPTNFTRRFSASQTIVKRIDLYGKLHGHDGCVNAVEFNSTGELLVSGSDDREVKLWNWATLSENFSYPSGHSDHVFQTKIMPFSDDRKIVTSASDGQVRLGQVLENARVDTKRLGKHQGRVFKLAVEPGSPHTLYSCGEDGFVQHFDIRSNSATKLFCCFSFTENKAQAIRLNTIVIDPRNPVYFSVGGSDEYARVYDIRNYKKPTNTFCPHHLIESGSVHITGLAYSNASELLVSYNDELIYLFQKNMGFGSDPLSSSFEDSQEVESPQVYSGHRNSQTIKGVSFFGPGDEYVVSGSDCGHIFIWTKNGGKLVNLMVGDLHIVNQIESHPKIPFLATCGIEKTIKIWAPMKNDDVMLPGNVEEIKESNRQGREDHSRVSLTPEVVVHVLRLQRRQTLAYTDRTYNRADISNEEEDDDREAYLIEFSDGNSSFEEGFSEHPQECNVC